MNKPSACARAGGGWWGAGCAGCHSTAGISLWWQGLQRHGMHPECGLCPAHNMAADYSPCSRCKHAAISITQQALTLQRWQSGGVTVARSPARGSSHRHRRRRRWCWRCHRLPDGWPGTCLHISRMRRLQVFLHGVTRTAHGALPHVRGQLGGSAGRVCAVCCYREGGCMHSRGGGWLHVSRCRLVCLHGCIHGPCVAPSACLRCAHLP